jgi:hypothetical protein
MNTPYMLHPEFIGPKAAYGFQASTIQFQAYKSLFKNNCECNVLIKILNF